MNWVDKVLASVKSFKANVSSVIPQSDSHNSSICSDYGLTLETSALKLFTVANLRYQLSW